MAISNKNAVQGIVHGLSNTGSTVYIEPQQVIDLNNRLRLAQGELKAEEQRIRRYSLYSRSSLCWYKSANSDVICLLLPQHAVSKARLASAAGAVQNL